VAAEAAFHFMLGSRDVVNLTTFNKTPRPRYIDSHHARYLFDNSGASIYRFASDENPDIILTAAGDIATHETLEAMKILRADMPKLKMRFVGINALSYRAIGTTDNKLSHDKFDELFLEGIPIVANFHGYPETLENILENYTERRRLRVHGFNEEGSTTTPFEMLRKNVASRYDIAYDIAAALWQNRLANKYQDILDANHEHAVFFGEDLIK
jgi:xylulose-5-phosphate/fructose-6-phosphate phosphoketolase